MRNLNQDWIERTCAMNFKTAENNDLCGAYLVCLEETTMEESTAAFWDRVLQFFVNLNESFGDIRFCCLRYKKILMVFNMDQEAAIFAYAAYVGREFKFMEAYEIINGNVWGFY
ncbi:hypothetical protein MKX03_008262 [Papaver bracteatum]|nr:hypothetical protein MKX03_008262 [Papaver bracteatum]